MKILIDARESGTTTGRYIDKLIQNLQKLDRKNEYLILYKKHRLALDLLSTNNFKGVECNIKEFSFAEQFKLKRQINSLKPDLVHFGMVQQPILYRGSVVTTMHDLTTLRFRNPAKNKFVFRSKQIVYKYVNKRAAKKSLAIFTPTDYVKKDILKLTKVNPNKIHVTYEAADKIHEPAEPIKELEGQEFIMYVGRPQPHKNLGRLIDAFAILLKTHPKLKLVLVGKTDVLFLQHKKYAEEKGISDSVIFTGFASEGQLRWLYENCRAYVFPSLSEGFGLPGLEAMMHGAPVVSSNATCLPEIYDDAAYYFSPHSTKDMAEKIKDVLDSRSLRGQLIRKGFNQAKRFSWRRMAEQTLKVYNEVGKNT